MHVPGGCDNKHLMTRDVRAGGPCWVARLRFTAARLRTIDPVPLPSSSTILAAVNDLGPRT